MSNGHTESELRYVDWEDASWTMFLHGPKFTESKWRVRCPHCEAQTDAEASR